MRLYSLGSGSSGNGFVVDTDRAAILVDCGVGIRSCQSTLRDLGVLQRLAGIVVSHEHTDHIRAIPSVLRRVDCPVVTTVGTYTAMRRTLGWSQRRAGERFEESGIEISFVQVSHDAAEPCGFVVEADGLRIAVFTDLGYVSEEVIAEMTAADIIVLESNFDRGMLARGGYPAHLKRRIQSPVGHLSNDDCATALVAAASERTRGVWLAHLSHNNNTPERALATAREALTLAGLQTPIRALPRYDCVEITSLPARQLGLSLTS
jgi:phosphoribosyl 1,2-cyclic phosphodiesterase